MKNENQQEEIKQENNDQQEQKKKKITQEDIMKMLDACYEKALNGIPLVSESVSEMAEDYLSKHPTTEAAIKAMLKNQVWKCTTSGFITGFGGVLTLPITIPANIGSVIYVQMRMIACVAYMTGYDLKSDQTQTFVYACLAGISLNEFLKKAGIVFGVKYAKGMLNKLPGKVLTKINQKVGFRFLTKFGTKGVINLWKLIPVVGAVVGGGFDYAETKIIAKRAYRWFYEGDTTETDDKDNDDIVIDVDDASGEDN